MPMRNPLLVPDLRELIEAGEQDGVRDFLSDHHPGEVGDLIEDLQHRLAPQLGQRLVNRPAHLGPATHQLLVGLVHHLDDLLAASGEEDRRRRL